MNGASLTLGFVGLLVGASALSRGSRSSTPPEVFHVTTLEAARDILVNGFLPGWGDVGLGVYFFGTEVSARRYARLGGWDGGLRGEHVVILGVQDLRVRPASECGLDPSWDASGYADMWFLSPDEGDDADEDEYVKLDFVQIRLDLGSESSA
jgi:hypothetical protein